MRKLFLFLSLMALVSCSTFKEWRRPASFGRDLTGTYLGVADYKFGHIGPNNAATRLYLQEVEGERGSYYALIHEYVDLAKMFPKYVYSNKLPAVGKVLGFLKDISKKIEVYKMVPTEAEGTFNFLPIKVEGNKFVTIPTSNPRQLILRKEEYFEHPLVGARITSNGDKSQPKKIFFPMKNDKEYNGVQYAIASLVYNKIGLDSTWRMNFLSGPYLASYGRIDDTVLDLSSKDGVDYMIFKENPKMKNKSAKERAKMFTNKKSSRLEGTYETFEAADGMFLLKGVKTNKKTDSVLNGRIGLFIDIFDATKKLNQDVVELIFVDPANPEDFLMYYEHPENGEGK